MERQLIYRTDPRPLTPAEQADRERLERILQDVENQIDLALAELRAQMVAIALKAAARRVSGQ